MNTIWIPELSPDDGPKYVALAEALRRAVASGDLPEGTRLPTVRDLAWRLSVTPGTVARAYQMATQEGLLQATVGRGTFVADRAAALPPLRATPSPGLIDPPMGVEPLPNPDVLDMRSPYLPLVGQAQAFSAALQRVGQRTGQDWLAYTSQEKEAPLRTAVCDWLADRNIGPMDASQVMLTLGGQNAIGLVMDACLTGERPVVLIEDLAFPGFRYAARLARATVVAVEMDGQGMCPEALEAACRTHRPQLLCLMPEVQNPTAARMGSERRQRIVAIAQRYNLQIIEDECYAPTTTPHPGLRALAPERTWYIGSFSKTVSASLRFGYVVCPEGQGEAARMVVQHNYYALPQPLSALCLDLLQTGAAEAIRRDV
ncbi:MAG: PLP-dependent aminotransferase family protein, partial [Paracoccaceae bacterium]